MFDYQRVICGNSKLIISETSSVRPMIGLVVVDGFHTTAAVELHVGCNCRHEMPWYQLVMRFPQNGSKGNSCNTRYTS